MLTPRILRSLADEVVRQTVGGSVGRELTFAQATQAVGRADPKVAFGVVEEREDDVAGESLFGRVGFDAPVPQEAQASAVSPDPDVTPSVFVDRLDEVARKPLPRRVRSELLVLELAQSARLSSDPQAPLIRTMASIRFFRFQQRFRPGS